jgi:hypothetical protein
MTAGWLEYRCTRCGEVFKVTQVPDIKDSIIAVLWNAKTPVTFHECSDGVGIAEMVGGAYDTKAAFVPQERRKLFQHVEDED